MTVKEVCSLCVMPSFVIHWRRGCYGEDIEKIRDHFVYAPSQWRRHYVVTSPLTGWAHTQSDPWIIHIAHCWTSTQYKLIQPVEEPWACLYMTSHEGNVVSKHRHSRLFVPPLASANKTSHQSPYNWRFVRGITNDRRIPFTKSQ